MSLSAQTFTIMHTFTNAPDGAFPHCGLTLSGGTLYGVASGGSSSYDGALFQIGTNGSGYSTMRNFTGLPDGSTPEFCLTATNGILYGTTSSGGNIGYGTVFKIGTSGSGYQILKNFSSYDTNNGASPGTKLVLDGGYLYGTVSSGGVSNYGAIFRLAADGSSYTLLKSFYLYDGWNPLGGLTLYNGVLYGTTYQGGTNGDGVVFKINEDGSSYTVIRSFNGSDGSSPKGGLIVADGVIYGSTYSGGSPGFGSVFKMNIDGTGFTSLKGFNGTSGGSPQGNLVLNGNTLYGTSSQYGRYGDGNIFKVNTDGSGFAVLHSFNGSDGSQINGDLAYNNGVLYGTAANGGSSSDGDVFSLVLPPPPSIMAGSSFGIATNCFGFVVSAPSNQPVAIDICTNLGGNWTPVQTNTLGAGTNAFYFSDPKWTNYPVRYYRIREP